MRITEELYNALKKFKEELAIKVKTRNSEDTDESKAAKELNIKYQITGMNTFDLIKMLHKVMNEKGEIDLKKLSAKQQADITALYEELKKINSLDLALIDFDKSKVKIVGVKAGHKGIYRLDELSPDSNNEWKPLATGSALVLKDSLERKGFSLSMGVPTPQDPGKGDQCILSLSVTIQGLDNINHYHLYVNEVVAQIKEKLKDLKDKNGNKIENIGLSYSESSKCIIIQAPNNADFKDNLVIVYGALKRITVPVHIENWPNNPEGLINNFETNHAQKARERANLIKDVKCEKNRDGSGYELTIDLKKSDKKLLEDILGQSEGKAEILSESQIKINLYLGDGDLESDSKIMMILATYMNGSENYQKITDAITAAQSDAKKEENEEKEEKDKKEEKKEESAAAQAEIKDLLIGKNYFTFNLAKGHAGLDKLFKTAIPYVDSAGVLGSHIKDNGAEIYRNETENGWTYTVRLEEYENFTEKVNLTEILNNISVLKQLEKGEKEIILPLNAVHHFMNVAAIDLRAPPESAITYSTDDLLFARIHGQPLDTSSFSKDWIQELDQITQELINPIITEAKNLKLDLKWVSLPQWGFTIAPPLEDPIVSAEIYRDRLLAFRDSPALQTNVPINGLKKAIDDIHQNIQSVIEDKKMKEEKPPSIDSITLGATGIRIALDNKLFDLERRFQISPPTDTITTAEGFKIKRTQDPAKPEKVQYEISIGVAKEIYKIKYIEKLKASKYFNNIPNFEEAVIKPCQKVTALIDKPFRLSEPAGSQFVYPVNDNLLEAHISGKPITEADIDQNLLFQLQLDMQIGVDALNKVAASINCGLNFSLGKPPNVELIVTPQVEAGKSATPLEFKGLLEKFNGHLKTLGYSNIDNLPLVLDNLAAKIGTVKIIEASDAIQTADLKAYGFILRGVGPHHKKIEEYFANNTLKVKKDSIDGREYHDIDGFMVMKTEEKADQWSYEISAIDITCILDPRNIKKLEESPFFRSLADFNVKVLSAYRDAAKILANPCLNTPTNYQEGNPPFAFIAGISLEKLNRGLKSEVEQIIKKQIEGLEKFPGLVLSLEKGKWTEWGLKITPSAGAETEFLENLKQYKVKLGPDSPWAAQIDQILKKPPPKDEDSDEDTVEFSIRDTSGRVMGKLPVLNGEYCLKERGEKVALMMVLNAATPEETAKNRDIAKSWMTKMFNLPDILNKCMEDASPNAPLDPALDKNQVRASIHLITDRSHQELSESLQEKGYTVPKLNKEERTSKYGVIESHLGRKSEASVSFVTDPHDKDKLKIPGNLVDELYEAAKSLERLLDRKGKLTNLNLSFLPCEGKPLNVRQLALVICCCHKAPEEDKKKFQTAMDDFTRSNPNFFRTANLDADRFNDLTKDIMALALADLKMEKNLSPRPPLPSLPTPGPRST